jgi:hypothetical protein
MFSQPIAIFSTCRKEKQNKMLENFGIYACFAFTDAKSISSDKPQNAYSNNEKIIYGTINSTVQYDISLYCQQFYLCRYMILFLTEKNSLEHGIHNSYSYILRVDDEKQIL